MTHPHSVSIPGASQTAIRPPTLVDNGLLALSVLMFSQNFVSLRVAVAEMDPFWIVTLRLLAALAILLPFALWRGFYIPQDLKTWLLTAALALLNVVIPFLLFTISVRYITASEASLIVGTVPLFGLIVSHFSTDDDRFTIWKFAGVALGIAGIAVLFGGEALAGASYDILAYLAMLVASISLASSGALIRYMGSRPPVRMTSLMYLVALPVFLVLTGAFAEPLPASPSTLVLAHIVFLGIFPSGLGYIIRFKLIPAIGYSYFSLTLNAVPVGGVILGALALGETVTPPMMAALAMILSGLAVSRIGSR